MMVEFSCIRYLLLLNHTQKIILNRISISFLNYFFYLFLITSLNNQELVIFGYIWVFSHILINFGTHIIVNPTINLLEAKDANYFLSGIIHILVLVIAIYFFASFLFINSSELDNENLNIFMIFSFVSSATIFDLTIRFKTIINDYNEIVLLVISRALILLILFLIGFWIKFSFDLKIIYFSILNLIIPFVIFKKNYSFFVPRSIYFKIFQFNKYEFPKFILSFFSMHMFFLISYKFIADHEFLSSFVIIFGFFGFLNIFFLSINEIIKVNITKIELLLKNKINFLIKLLLSFLIILLFLLFLTFNLITFIEKNNYLNDVLIKYSYIFYYAEIYFSVYLLNSLFDSILMVKGKNKFVFIKSFIRAAFLFTVGILLMIFFKEFGFLNAIIISVITYLFISVYFFFRRI